MLMIILGKELSKQISSEVVPFSKKIKISTYFKNIRFSTQGIMEQ